MLGTEGWEVPQDKCLQAQTGQSSSEKSDSGVGNLAPFQGKAE